MLHIDRVKNKSRRDKYRTDPAYRNKSIRLSVEWAQNNREKNLLRSARFRAKKKGVPFNLEATDIIIPEVCPVLGMPLTTQNDKQRDSSPSIDRIRPSLGYVKGNIEIVSWRANNLKRNATVAELEKVLAWMKSQPS